MLEHLSGGEMLRQLQRMKRYTEASACQMFKQVRVRPQPACCGLRFAWNYSRGYVHVWQHDRMTAAQSAGRCYLVRTQKQQAVPSRSSCPVDSMHICCSCVLLQVVDAVAYLHSLGILHRDIKPENCLLVKPASHYASKNKPVKASANLSAPARVLWHVQATFLLGRAAGLSSHFWQPPHRSCSCSAGTCAPSSS